jgi:hypothetical protein
MRDFFNKQNNSSDYKMMADRCLLPYKNRLALIYFIYFLICFAVSLIDSAVTGSSTVNISVDGTVSTDSGLISDLFNIFCTGSFIFSFIFMCDKVYRNVEPVTEDLFFGFKMFGKKFIGLFIIKYFNCFMVIIISYSWYH